MKQKELTDLTEQELIKEEKSQKQLYYFYNGLIGFMIGIAIYSFAKKGFNLFSFLPLIFIPFIIIMNKNYKAIKNEIKRRKNN
jgi:hypothetical protein